MTTRISTRSAVATLDDLTDLVHEGGDKILSVTGGAGRLTRKVRAQLKAASDVFSKQGNSASRAFGAAVHKENMIVKARVLKELGDIGIKSARLRGLVINVGFARALTFNPSGRISDRDLKTSIESIGAKSGDKESFLAALGDTRKIMIRDLNIREDVLGQKSTAFKPRPQRGAPKATRTGGRGSKRILFDAQGNIVSGGFR